MSLLQTSGSPVVHCDGSPYPNIPTDRAVWRWGGGGGREWDDLAYLLACGIWGQHKDARSFLC